MHTALGEPRAVEILEHAHSSEESQELPSLGSRGDPGTCTQLRGEPRAAEILEHAHSSRKAESRGDPGTCTQLRREGQELPSLRSCGDPETCTQLRGEPRAAEILEHAHSSEESREPWRSWNMHTAQRRAESDLCWGAAEI
ncbi:UNVERIFIED_CONTAM: hypothetical protein FKN15_037909 [Acipenser sinensis]